MRTLIALAGAWMSMSGCTDQSAQAPAPAEQVGTRTLNIAESGDTMPERIERTDEEWRELLTPEEYHILREAGTENPYTGEYWQTTTPGNYKCLGCGAELFTSDEKFISSCGWPAFSAPADDTIVTEHKDRTIGIVRTEVRCSKCDSHLGHVFNDGPGPTGLRYCINSACLELEEDPSRKPAKPE